MNKNNDDEDKRREEMLDKIELAILSFIFAVFTALLLFAVGEAAAQ